MNELSSYTAAVVGATGLVGARCLDVLAQDPSCTKVVAPVRTQEFKAPSHSKVEVTRIDFDKLSQYGDLFRVDRIFCCLGTTRRKAGSRAGLAAVDRDLVIKIARIAAQVGVKHFSALSSSGADLHSPFFYLRTKAEMEEEILKMPFASVHILRPGLLLGKREEFRLGEKLTSSILELISNFLPERMQPIHAQTLAEAIVELPKHAGWGKKIFESEALQRGSRITNILQEDFSRQNS